MTHTEDKKEHAQREYLSANALSQAFAEAERLDELDPKPKTFTVMSTPTSRGIFNLLWSGR